MDPGPKFLPHITSIALLLAACRQAETADGARDIGPEKASQSEAKLLDQAETMLEQERQATGEVAPNTQETTKN